MTRSRSSRAFRTACTTTATRPCTRSGSWSAGTTRINSVDLPDGRRPRRATAAHEPVVRSRDGQLVDITMPRLSDSMEEATILQWLKQPGDARREGRAARRGRDGQGDDRLRGRGDGVLAEVVVARRRHGRARRGDRAARVAGEAPAAAPGRCRPRAPAPEAEPERALSARRSPSRPRRRARRAGAGRATEGAGRDPPTPSPRRLRELGVGLDRVSGTGPGRPHRPCRCARAAGERRAAPAAPLATRRGATVDRGRR